MRAGGTQSGHDHQLHCPCLPLWPRCPALQPQTLRGHFTQSHRPPQPSSRMHCSLSLTKCCLEPRHMPMRLAWHLQPLRNARSAREQPHPHNLKAPPLKAVSPQASGPTFRILPTAPSPQVHRTERVPPGVISWASRQTAYVQVNTESVTAQNELLNSICYFHPQAHNRAQAKQRKTAPPGGTALGRQNCFHGPLARQQLAAPASANICRSRLLHNGKIIRPIAFQSALKCLIRTGNLMAVFCH